MVRRVDAEAPSAVAVIRTDPGARPRTVPVAGSTAATDESLLVQATEVGIWPALRPSPTARRSSISPTAIGCPPRIWIAATVAGNTVSSATAVSRPHRARMTVVPGAAPRTTPVDGSIVATLGRFETHRISAP